MGSQPAARAEVFHTVLKGGVPGEDGGPDGLGGGGHGGLEGDDAGHIGRGQGLG